MIINLRALADELTDALPEDFYLDVAYNHLRREAVVAVRFYTGGDLDGEPRKMHTVRRLLLDNDLAHLQINMRPIEETIGRELKATLAR